jgi:diacylglycerol kinase family enzyme
VTMLRGVRVHLCTEDGQPFAFQLDGELREVADGAAGISISVLPAKLNVIRGAGPAPGTAAGR